MRALGIAAVLIIAACDRAAVVIVVEPVDAVATVRLFVGVGDPRSLALTPAPGSDQTSALPIGAAHAWSLDPHGGDEVAQLDAGDDPRWVFTPGDLSLSTVVAVGFSANGRAVADAAATDLVMPSDHVEEHHLVLSPAAERTGGLIVCGSADAQPCVFAPGLAKDDDGLLLVRGDDADCDGFDNSDERECRADVYLADEAPPSLDDVSCLATAPEGWCSLGGPRCTDGKPATETACADTPYCAPDDLCAACGDDLACAADLQAQNDPAGTWLECHFPIVGPGGPGGQRLCGNGEFADEIDADLWCTDVEVRGAGPDAAWTRVVEDSVAKLAFDLHSNNPGGCPVHVNASTSHLDELLAMGHEMDGIVALSLHDGTQIALPLRAYIEATPLEDCPQVVSCTVHGALGPLADPNGDCRKAHRPI